MVNEFWYFGKLVNLLMIKYFFEYIGFISNFYLSSMCVVNMVIVNISFYLSMCGVKLCLFYCFYLFFLYGLL